MGRNKSINSSSTNPEKLNTEEGIIIVDLVQNIGENENNNENNFELQSRNIDFGPMRNSKRQPLINSIQSTKKDEFGEEIKEVKRSRGRPRKNLIDMETRKALKKSYTENDEDVLKFENEVYENEDALNLQLENSSIDITGASNFSRTVKQQPSSSSKFEIEAKISTESIITISSEENSNSNPVVRALQCTPTSERNLPSPDVLQVQFNPSSAKTYKNKRKFTNTALDSNIVEKNSIVEPKTADELIQKDCQIDKSKTHITKSSTNFEINPNFIRNTRKKVLKYDVCDLLNKKSHKKIQIEARIDSMPAKSKLNLAKTSDTSVILDTRKNEPSPAKVVPKINELPSIIRKIPQTEKEFSVQDTVGNKYGFIEQVSPPKSLIQIQGKSSYTIEQQNAGRAFDPNMPSIISDAPIKRRPGRPKIKKDSSNLNISVSPKIKPGRKMAFNQLHDIDSPINKGEIDKKITLLEFENTEFVDSDNDNLAPILNSTNRFQSENVETTSSQEIFSEKVNLNTEIKDSATKICENTSEKLMCYDTPLPVKFTYNSASVEDSIPKKGNLKKGSELEEITKEISQVKETTNLETILPQLDSNDKKRNINDTIEIYNKDVYKMISSDSKPTESLVLSPIKIKDAHVLIKGMDKIKIIKSDHINIFALNNSHSLGKKLSKEIEEKLVDNLKVLAESESKLQILNDKSEKFSEELNLGEISNIETINEILNVDTVYQNKLNSPKEKTLRNEQDEFQNVEAINNFQSFPNSVKLIEKSNDTLTNSPSIQNVKDLEGLTSEESRNCIKFLNESSFSSQCSAKWEEETQNIEYSIGTKDIFDKSNNENLLISTKTEKHGNENIKNLSDILAEGDVVEENNKDSPISMLEKSGCKTIPQQIKPKEIKTGMDIWLEKVQLESKLKILSDSIKKNKTEKIQKPKAKEENKSKSESKTKYDFNFKLEPIYKGEHKLKESPTNKEDHKLYNVFKSKKESKEKFENKIKLLVPKQDSKGKEVIKNKDGKDKKPKDKDETKNKNEIKIETKIKSESIVLKEHVKADKEESSLKQKIENKNNKNDVYGNLKNETSLRTIDIFNFAAKDEIAHKVYNKKKNKKPETWASAQDKMQVIKFDAEEVKNDNEKDVIQKKTVVFEKSPRTMKDMKVEKSAKSEDSDTNIEMELIKKKVQPLPDENKSQVLQNVDEEESNNHISPVPDLDSKFENNSMTCLVENLQETVEENMTQKDIIAKKATIFTTYTAHTTKNILQCDANSNQKLDSSDLNIQIPSLEQLHNFPSSMCPSDENPESKLPCQFITKCNETEENKIESGNQDIQKGKPELLSHEIPETIESTNEILDPLKDIESFLEAAGNLLSRSHSSDDEKDSIGRRTIRSRQSDDKNSPDQYDNKKEITCDIEDKLKSIERENEKFDSLDESEDTFCNREKKNEVYIENVNEFVTEINSVDTKTKLISDLTNVESNSKEKRNDSSLSNINILTPIKMLQKEKREEWFSQIDSSIDKDLNDEVSFESIKNYNESTPISKKNGTGPRTPPLPPPLSDEEIEKNKTKNDNLSETKQFYDQGNLENDIANSIISTSIKIPISMATSLHELKFMGSPKDQNVILDEQLKIIENQINRKSKKKSEASQKDKELKKFLKTLKKNELSKDWKKTYKELKKIKKKSVEGFAVSKSSLKYSPENNMPSIEDSVNSHKIKKSSDLQDEYNNNNSTIRRSHRLKSIAMQQQSQQIAIGRGGLVRNDYEDLIRADLAQVQAQNTKFLKAMENSLNQFKQIKENEYKCERVLSKEAKRMICDCFLTKEEEERGEYGCGEDCLNRLLMIECGPKCNVGDRCTNKRFQRGQYAPCRVFMTEKKGCGIFAEVEIPAGEFIMEYVGEVVDSEQFEKRAAEYSASKNKHFYFMSLRSNAIIDATSRGNISRFINHSCDPNAETQKWTVNGELHIGFFTTRTVGLGDEITFDYQFQRYGKQAQKCYCEAVNCRGWIGEEPDSDEEIEEDIELDFKSKEDLEKISKGIQSYINKDKTKTLEDNIVDAEKLLTRKDDINEPVLTKLILTDEELKIKLQEREQRKKDKQRKREIRLAQQKHDFLEDPDLEDEIYRLSKTGLKNQVQTLRLSRLIVRAKLLQTRSNLLEILRAGEIPCRRLFLDYHGLKLLHGWMNESDCTATEDNLKMRFAILETLNCLPIPNRTMLKESKVYQIVHNWTQDKIITISPIDGSASDSNSSHAVAIKEKLGDPAVDQSTKEIQSEIKSLAVKLIDDWEVLPEVFRIPRKERVEQMKEHEREADRRYAALHVAEDERESKSNRDRYKKSRWDNSVKMEKWRWSNKTDNSKERRKIDQEKLDDGLTKEQRRQAFAAKVAQDEADKLNAEKRRNLEYEARREFEFKCKFFLLDCTKTHPRDIPFCVDQKTNTWFTLDKRKIPTPPSHIHIKIPPRSKTANPSDYKLPKMDLPSGWKFAIEPIQGRIYYYHVKIRRPQWEPPPKIYPLINPENNINATISGSNIAVNTNDIDSSDSSDSDSESVDETDALSLLVQERSISPRKEEDRVYNQNEMRRYKENKEKIRRRKEEIKRRKARILLKSSEQLADEFNINLLNESDPLPIADYLISSEEDEAIVEELDSKLIEKIVKGESIVDELDALKTKKPLKRPLTIKEKSNANGASNTNSNSIIAEFKKRPKLEDKKHKNNDEFKKSKSANKNSRYFARKAKEKFRSDIAGIIVQHLQPYRKDSCQLGKITTNEDFKHLARKLTHFVMIKELKHCDSTGQTLIVTDSVKNKSREFIKKYMAKYGEIYIRPESDPEYKELPL